MNDTNWVPGIIVASLGAGTAIAVLLSNRRTKTTDEQTFAADQQDRLADRERKVHELLEELRELDQDQHHLPAAAFAAEQARLEKEAAEALRARDEFMKKMGGPQAPAPLPADAGFFAKNPAIKGAVWGAAIVLFFVTLGIVLTQEQKPREDMGGPQVMAPPTGPSASEQAEALKEEAEFNKLNDRLKTNPDDVELISAVAHQMLRRQQFTEAAALTEKALTLDPFHTESRIHRAVLRGLRGEERVALDELETIGRAHPDGVEALLFAGALAMEVNEPKRALAAFEAYAATAPVEDRPPQLQMGIELLRKQLAGGSTPPQMPPPVVQNGNGQQVGNPPPLTAEQIEAFEQMQQSPEFQAQALKTIDAAELDLAGKKFQEALDKYKSVMPVLPQNGRAKAGMAYALLGLNRQPMADRVWSVAVQSDAAAVDGLGDSLVRLGDHAGAKQVWAKLTESAPGYAGLDTVKKKLQR